MSNSQYQRLLAGAFNRPVALEPGYARVFFSALANRVGGIDRLIDVNGEVLDTNQMQLEASSFSRSRAEHRSYKLVDGIAVVPVDGSLTHKLGALHPYSGMTGYDGIHRKLTEAMSDPDVRGVMLDIDSPGGMVAGCFDLADIIARYRDMKPIWSLGYDMHCSAAQMIASACSHRLITQTGVAGSVGVIMAHANVEKMLAKQGTEITLITAGKHKADGNPYEALPEHVRDKWQKQLEATRLTFATKAAGYMNIDVNQVLATEAETFEGEAAIEAGFANELVNGTDAIAVMSEHLNAQGKKIIDMGSSMTTEKDKTKPNATVAASGPADDGSQPGNVDLVANERDRIMGILDLDEAKGREATASELAKNPNMDIAAAKSILASIPLATTQRDDVALAALSTQHGESLSSDENDSEQSDDQKQVGVLLSAFCPKK